MRALRRLAARAAGLVGATRRDGDFARELESHLQLHVDDNVRTGMTRDAARRAALISLGGIGQTEERYRDQDGLRAVERLLQDLRLAIRNLRKRPLLVASAAVSIGIGVGLNIGLYSMVRAVLLDSFISTAEPDRLSWVSEGMSFPDYDDIQQASSPVELAAMQMTTLVWNDDGATRSSSAHVVSWNFFDTLGVHPLLGRAFSAAVPADSRDPDEVVLSYGFWQRRLGADLAVVGRTIFLSGRPYRVAGVLPRGFSSMLLASPDLYVPIDEHVTSELFSRNAAQFDILARSPAGMTREQAAALVRTVAERVEQSVTRTHTGWARAIVFQRPSGLGLLGAMLPGGAILGVTVVAFALAGLVLLIACTNVAGLLVARADERRHETAVRFALGASQGRIAQQFLVESLVLAALGSGVGAVAWWLVVELARTSSLFAEAGAQFPGLSGATPLLYAATLAGVVMIVCGALPAFAARQAAPVSALRRESAIRAMRPIVVQRVLVASQVAVSFVLLAAATAFLYAFLHLRATDPGFDADHTVHVDTRATANTRLPTFLELREAVQGLPGVESVTGTRLPLAFIPLRQQLRSVGEERGVSADVEPVKSRYFETMGIPLERGRDIADDDLRRPQAGGIAAVANDSFARQYLATDGVGRAMFVVPADTENGIPEQTLQVVGVARDSLGKKGVPTLFMADPRPRELVVRVSGPAESAVKMLQAAVAERERGATVTAAPMSDQIAVALLPMRIGATVLCALGALALLLAMVGLHGAVSYAASRRTFEIGVRVALGAPRRSIVRMVLRDGTTAVAAGCAVGIVASAGLLMLLRPFIAGFSARLELPVILAVLFTLLLVGAAATLRPALRATRVDPLIALRTE